MTNNLPMCAKCGRPVDKIMCIEDPMTRTTRYVVSCHGDQESVRLSYKDVVDSNHIEFGFAFAGERILPGVTR